MINTNNTGNEMPGDVKNLIEGLYTGSSNMYKSVWDLMNDPITYERVRKFIKLPKIVTSGSDLYIQNSEETSANGFNRVVRFFIVLDQNNQPVVDYNNPSNLVRISKANSIYCGEFKDSILAENLIHAYILKVSLFQLGMDFTKGIGNIYRFEQLMQLNGASTMDIYNKAFNLYMRMNGPKQDIAVRTATGTPSYDLVSSRDLM